MDVAVYLKALLIDRGESGLPGLGNFSSQYIPAYFDEAAGVFHPPHRDYFFDSGNDNLGIALAKYIAEKENISATEAGSEIEEYVKDCWYILNKGQRLQLMGVGVIFKDESGKLCFEADPLLVHGGEFYALGSIAAVKHRVEAPAIVRPKKKFPLKTVLAIFMVIALFLGGLWVGKLVRVFQRKMELRGPLTDSAAPAKTDLMADTLVDSARLVNDSLDVKPDSASYAPVVVPEPAKEVTREITGPSSTPKGSEEGSFVIIGGCFRSEEGAKKFNRQLISKGYPSQILGKTGSGLTMVSYSAYPDKASAREALETIRQEGDSGAYIIKRNGER